MTGPDFQELQTEVETAMASMYHSISIVSVLEAVKIAIQCLVLAGNSQEYAFVRQSDQDNCAAALHPLAALRLLVSKQT